LTPPSLTFRIKMIVFWIAIRLCKSHKNYSYLGNFATKKLRKNTDKIFIASPIFLVGKTDLYLFCSLKFWNKLSFFPIKRERKIVWTQKVSLTVKLETVWTFIQTIKVNNPLLHKETALVTIEFVKFFNFTCSYCLAKQIVETEVVRALNKLILQVLFSFNWLVEKRVGGGFP